MRVWGALGQMLSSNTLVFNVFLGGGENGRDFTGVLGRLLEGDVCF
jgi:hypothetical protein